MDGVRQPLVMPWYRATRANASAPGKLRVESDGTIQGARLFADAAAAKFGAVIRLIRRTYQRLSSSDLLTRAFETGHIEYDLL